MKLRDYQQEAVSSVFQYFYDNREGNPVIASPTGCHAKGHGILMFDGSIKSVENIAVGDKLMGPDSKSRCVLGLARGRQEMRRIIPNKGEPFVVNLDHKLNVRKVCEKRNHLYSSQKACNKTITVREYEDGSDWFKHIHKLRRVSVDFETKLQPLAPYFIGLLLGDGSFASGGFNLTTSDEELAEYFTKYVHSFGLKIRVSNKINNKAKTYHASGKKGRGGNCIGKIIRDIGLMDKRSWDKHIPDIYKLGDRGQRIELLAGLIDSDGYIGNDKTLEFTTVSEKLAEDMMYLIRSLGLGATCKKKHGVLNGEKKRLAYRIHVSGDYSFVPFKRHKHVGIECKQNRDPLITGFTIEALPEDNYYGFELDGDHLYLDKNFIVHHNTGKSLIIAGLVKEILSNYCDQKILVLTHVKELIEQNHEKLLTYWPSAPAGIHSAGLGQRDFFNKVIFGGIGSVYKHADRFGFVNLIIIDECHLLSNSENSMYQLAIAKLKEINPYLRVIGLSATPWRLGQGMITEDDGLFTDICFDITGLSAFNRLINEGYLIPLIPKRTSTFLDTDGIHITGGDFNKKELQLAFDKKELTEAALLETMELGQDRNSWLIYTTGIEHTMHAWEMLKAYGIPCGYVHSGNKSYKMSDKERDENIKKFRSGEYKALINSNILTTGFDHPMVDLIAILNATQSTGKWCLDQKTEVLTKSGFKKWDEIKKSDIAVTYNNSSGKIEESPILGYVHRDMTKDEYFVCIEKPGTSIRVSNKHRMLIAYPFGRIKSRISKFVLAEDIADTYWQFYLPVSANGDYPGTGLSKYELIFLGLFLSDGSLDKSNNTLAITQSNRYKSVQNEIEHVLDSCGFSYRIRHVNPDPHGTNGFATEHGKKIYLIGKGKGLKVGWGSVIKFVDKRVPACYDNMTRDEFKHLLSGLNLGDGTKFNSPSIDWIPRTFNIAMGNDYEYMNRIQQLAVTRGFRANISYRKNCSMLNIKDIRWANHQKPYGKDTRPWLSYDYSKEKIWCIETEQGTIITRRNGKVVIMGNCQTLGRGTRPVYAPGYDLETTEGRVQSIAASPKQNCIAGGQRVLTDIGLVPIEDVTLEMKLWDGCEFVHHAGVICNGEEETIEYGGLIATRDHKVWTKEGWRAFGECSDKQIPITITGYNELHIQQSENHYWRSDSTKQAGLFGNRVYKMWDSFVKVYDFIKKKYRRLWKMRAIKCKSPGQVGIRYPFLDTGTLCISKATVHQSKRPAIFRLRWERYRVSFFNCFRHGFACLYAGLERWDATLTNGSNRQRWTLRNWKLKTHSSDCEHEQSEGKQSNAIGSFIQNNASGYTVRGYNFGRFFLARDEFRRSNKSLSQCTVDKTKRKVWDILNAGPRNRFTCEGLLVSNCLVLDFAKNTKRLGPINDPVVPRKKGKGTGNVPIKTCEMCGTYNHTSVRWCINCNHEFVFQTKLKSTAATDELIKIDLPELVEFKVDHITYAVHNKVGAPDSIKVSYFCGLRAFNEYVCPEHPGSFPRKKATTWWKDRTNLPFTPSCMYILDSIGVLKQPTHIRVWINKKYPEIMAHCFDGSEFGKITDIDPFDTPTIEANEIDEMPF